MELVSTNFDVYDDCQLETEGELAISSIIGNADFAEAQKLVRQAAAIAAGYKKARTSAANGDRESVTQKNNLGKDYRVMLRRLAYMTNALWAGDKVMLLKSGMKLTREKGQADEVAIPAAPVIARRPIPTSLLATATKVPTFKAITFMYTTAPATNDSVWIKKALKRKKCLFTNLATGTKYIFKIEVTGECGKVLSSENASFWTSQID